MGRADLRTLWLMEHTSAAITGLMRGTALGSAWGALGVVVLTAAASAFHSAQSKVQCTAMPNAQDRPPVTDLRLKKSAFQAPKATAAVRCGDRGCTVQPLGLWYDLPHQMWRGLGGTEGVML